MQLVARDGDRHCYGEGVFCISSEEELHMGEPRSAAVLGVLPPIVEMRGFCLCVQARKYGSNRIVGVAAFIVDSEEALPFAWRLGGKCVHCACNLVGRFDFGFGVLFPLCKRVVALVLGLVA